MRIQRIARSDLTRGGADSPANSEREEPERDVVVVEVGPRDGLQNEPELIPTDLKIAFVDTLSAAGLPVIEATSFVNPKAVPQLADAAELMAGIRRRPGVRYPVLVPNSKGLERAIAAHVEAIALFTSATEAFAEANVGTSIAGTFERFADVAVSAHEHGMWIRGYVSVAFGCPYAGHVEPQAVVPVAERLLTLGCDEICLADTIGVGTPTSVDALLRAVIPSMPLRQLGVHFHDTTGRAIANVEAALERGIRIFDAAAGGLGGCPFAPGAPGNLATEDLLAYLESAGLQTGVRSEAVADATAKIRDHISRRSTVPA
jgi:hydroxymethylglutaryl-CoA lyase